MGVVAAVWLAPMQMPLRANLAAEAREFAERHTASWRMRADYVLPSKQGFNIKDAGVFWPAKASADYYLIGSRDASSDHRLVWLELELTAN